LERRSDENEKPKESKFTGDEQRNALILEGLFSMRREQNEELYTDIDTHTREKRARAKKKKTPHAGGHE
jgi:hypothetical protein